ncbi:6264_t:CDS:2 [Racocetra fulgida]|uniref:6264_t:CDS:1 n=1 Tax=Racocetra fulgida TaxID=60492 RepID=A0A9N8VUR1_9GLOM|nr:6264_t:CDS:2 [Racocetra fulgida]
MPKLSKQKRHMKYMTSQKEEIFNNIREMPELQMKNALNLIESMRNPKGKHKNEIISV